METSPKSVGHSQLSLSSGLATNLIDQPHLLGHLLGYDRLKTIHSDWIKYVWGTTDDVNLQAHRGSYKTTAITIVGMIWYHLFNPEDRILLSRKNYKGACNTIVEMIGHYRRPVMREIYRRLWGIENFKLPTARKERIVLPTKQRSSKEGSVDASGIDTSVTGLHYERQIDDDVVAREDKESKAARLATIAYYHEQQNLRNPGGCVDVIGTPWHKNDLWSILEGIMKFPLGTPGMNIPGFTEAYIRKLERALTAQLMACNYHLIHIAESDRIFPDPVKGDWPKELQPRAYLDPAFGGENTTALTMIGNYRRQWYARGWVWPMDVTQLYQKIVNMLEQYKNGTLYVEDNADKGASARDLAQKWPAVERRTESMNKHTRIVTFAKQHFHKLIWAHDTQTEYMSQIIDYAEGEEPDDAPDSLAGMIRELAIGDADIRDRY